MGKAIILNDVSFALSNLGNVTILKPIIEFNNEHVTSRMNTGINLFDDSIQNWTLYANVTPADTSNAYRTCLFCRYYTNDNKQIGFTIQDGATISLRIGEITQASSVIQQSKESYKFGIKKLNGIFYLTGNGKDWYEVASIDYKDGGRLYIGGHEVEGYDWNAMFEKFVIFEGDVDIKNIWTL